MTPYEFIEGDCHYNTPIGQHQKALKRNIKILSAGREWEVLSYYLDTNSGCYVLDIEEKE